LHFLAFLQTSSQYRLKRFMILSYHFMTHNPQLSVESVTNSSLVLAWTTLCHPSALLKPSQNMQMSVDCTIPHGGPANVSLVDTTTGGSGTIIGGFLATFSDFCPTSGPTPADQSNIQYTLPDSATIGTKCQTPGACVVQLFWATPDFSQNYYYCNDVVMAAAPAVAAPPSPPATTPAAPATTPVAPVAPTVSVANGVGSAVPSKMITSVNGPTATGGLAAVNSTPKPNSNGGQKTLGSERAVVALVLVAAAALL